MKWRKRQKRITRKGRSNDEYCLESRSKKDRSCETNRNFLPRQKRHRKRMDSKRQTLKASLLFLYYPEGNTFVDLSLPLSAKLVIATWFLFFFFLNQRLESSVTIFLRNIGHGEGNWITNKRRKNQRTTDSMLRKYTKESVYRNIILFVRPRVDPVVKKYGYQNLGDSESFRFIAALLESFLDNLLKLAVKYVIPGRIQAIR